MNIHTMKFCDSLESVLGLSLQLLRGKYLLLSMYFLTVINCLSTTSRYIGFHPFSADESLYLVSEQKMLVTDRNAYFLAFLSLILCRLSSRYHASRP
jgi:hypothetical protein